MAKPSFEAVYDELQRVALRVAYRLSGPGGDPADAAAEALGRAWANWARIREPNGWVATVTARLALQHRRNNARGCTPAAAGPDPDADERLELVAALRRLPGRQRQIIALRYLADLPEAAVARALDVSVNTVHSQATTALAALRHTLGRGELVPILETTPIPLEGTPCLNTSTLANLCPPSPTTAPSPEAAVTATADVLSLPVPPSPRLRS